MIRQSGRAAAVAALALLAAACQRVPGAGPSVTVSGAPAPNPALVAALEGRSILLDEAGENRSCAWLDPAFRDYNFVENWEDIEQVLAWRVEGDDLLCTYDGAVMACYRISSVAPDRVFMTPDGADEARAYALAEGNQCG